VITDLSKVATLEDFGSLTGEEEKVLQCWGLPVGHLMNHGSIQSVARQMQQDGFCTDPPEYIQGYAELMAAVGG
jgi:hypothetical protein